MSSILVPSSAKRIATQILVIAELNGRKYFILKRRIMCENCSRLKMKTLERCQWRRCNVCNVNCELISNFLLIVDFEQANVCWVHIEKINTFEDKIGYIMRYVVVF